MSAITKKQLQELKKGFLADKKAKVVANALVKNDLTTISRVFEAESNNPNIFSIDIKTMPVTNQKSSGRCWIFSAMNVLREIIAKKYNIKEFELSQNYVAFYDKLEKCNWFMECIVKEKDAPLSSHENRFLLETAVSDGGQWNMLLSLVKKYGICPKSAMPETYQSSNTWNMNNLLNTRLRKFASDVHKAKDTDIEELRNKCLEDCYKVIVACFGMPPEKFTFEYYDKKDKYHAEYDVTPLSFYKDYLAFELDDYVSVINGPTSDKPYYQTYSVKHLGNVVAGEKICLLNLPLEEFKEATLKQMKDGNLVWFGCDCGKDGDRKSGLWDDNQYDYEGTFDIDLSMSKEEMLDTRHSAMNHAMVLTGVNLVKNKPNRWKIENSWGDEIANKGYFIASDTWFDKYMYVVAINKKYLSKKALSALKKAPVELEPWDPFGTLAD